MARAKREKFSPEDLLCRSIVVESRCSVPAGCQGWSQAAELHDAGKDGGSQQRRPLDGRVGGAPLGERPQPSPTALRRRHRAHHASIYPSESLPCLPDASCVVQPCSPDLGPGGLSASASAPGASCFPSGPCGIGLRATSAEARIQVAVLAGGHGGHGSGDLLGSIDWSLEFWGKTLYPARDAHLVRLHHKGEDGRRFFFLRLQASPKNVWSVWSRQWEKFRRHVLPPGYPHALRSGAVPLVPEAGGPPPLHAVPQAPRVGPLPEPGQHGPSGQAMSHIYRSRFRSPGPQPCGRCYPTPHYHALPPPRPATMDSSGLGSGHWGIRGPEGPSGDRAKAGPRPATSDPGSEGLAADLKKRRHPCLEQPLADQHHRTISVVPFLPSCRCRPSRRRALPTVIPPRPSAALDVTTTAAECPSTT